MIYLLTQNSEKESKDRNDIQRPKVCFLAIMYLLTVNEFTPLFFSAGPFDGIRLNATGSDDLHGFHFQCNKAEFY